MGIFLAQRHVRLPVIAAAAMVIMSAVSMIVSHTLFAFDTANFFFILSVAIGVNFILMEVDLPQQVTCVGTWLSGILLEIYLLHPYLKVMPTGINVLDISISIAVVLFVGALLAWFGKQVRQYIFCQDVSMFLKKSWKCWNLNRCVLILFVFSCIALWSAITKADEAKDYKQYYDQAIKFQRAIKKNPQNAKLYYLRAKNRQNMGKFQDAIRDYTIVIKLKPKSYPKAYWRRGLCLYKLGLYQLAIRDYSRCLMLVPKYDKVYFCRAKAYGKIGMIGKAKKDLESAVKYGPKYAPGARLVLEKLLTGRSDF